MKTKLKRWLGRYGPAELLAILGSFLSGIVINALYNNLVLTALAATWGENIGYYGAIIISDVRKARSKHGKLTLLIVFKLLRNLFLEFGPAEYLDSFIVRPFCMYLFPTLLKNVALGLIAGKFAADFIFYIPTIVAFELRNKFIKD